MSVADKFETVKQIVNLIVTMLPKLVDVVVEVISLIKGLKEA